MDACMHLLNDYIPYLMLKDYNMSDNKHLDTVGSRITNIHLYTSSIKSWANIEAMGIKPLDPKVPRISPHIVYLYTK